MKASVKKVGDKYVAKLYYGSVVRDGRRVPEREKRSFSEEGAAWVWADARMAAHGREKTMLLSDWLSVWVEEVEVRESTFRQPSETWASRFRGQLRSTTRCP